MGFKIPVAVNPFKTRTPTTALGRFGKSLNPLNPANAALILLEEVIKASPLPANVKAFTSYAGFGLPGVMFGLTERPAGAKNERELIKESLAYFAEKERNRRETANTRVDPLTQVGQQQTGVGTSDLNRASEAAIPLVRFPATPAGQYARYFGTPEFDYVFGEESRKKGAPEGEEEMLRIAGQLTAEKEPLTTYYRAQSAAGRAKMDQIKKILGYEEGSALAAWAEANPMLAQRLYAKAVA